MDNTTVYKNGVLELKVSVKKGNRETLRVYVRSLMIKRRLIC